VITPGNERVIQFTIIWFVLNLVKNINVFLEANFYIFGRRFNVVLKKDAIMVMKSVFQYRF